MTFSAKHPPLARDPAAVATGCDLSDVAVGQTPWDHVVEWNGGGKRLASPFICADAVCGDGYAQRIFRNHQLRRAAI